MWVDPTTGQLRAINPEAGYFGVVPGTNEQTNPNAMATHVARHDLTPMSRLLPDGDVWWEGKTADAAGRVHRLDRPALDARLRPQGRPSQQPLHRADGQQPRARPAAERSGRRAGLARSSSAAAAHAIVPLVFQAFNWIHGVYLGATLGSETTAAATGQVGVVRRDPMAMLPFIGYNIRDYLVHWFRMRKQMTDCPRIFHVNWFRKDDKRQIHLARLRRKHARPEMDHRPLPRPRLCQGNRSSAGCRAARTSIWKASNVTLEQFEQLQTLEPGRRQGGVDEPGGIIPETGRGFAEGDDFSEGIADQPAVAF